MNEKESFPPIIDLNSRILILGSMPGEESLARNQYYAFGRNSFWKIMGTLFCFSPDLPYEKRTRALLDNRVALWDVISKCDRTGSLDSKIKNEHANDFQDLFNRFPGITHIFFNGGKAHDVYKKHFGFSNEKHIYLKLPSTSPAHAIPFERKLESWSRILEFLS